MTTRDYVYLGMILLMGLTCYCHGFWAGVCRCQRRYDTLLDEAQASDDSGEVIAPTTEGGKPPAHVETVLGSDNASRDPKLVMPKSQLRGDFGNN